MRLRLSIRNEGPRAARRSWALLALMVVLAPLVLLTTTAEASYRRGSAVVVANRGSGDISVIDVATLDVDTVALPGDGEPMYVSHDRRRDRVWVGDRASNTVVAFDDESYEVVGTVPVGEGVFHQWLDQSIRQLWVVGDVANTVTVVDTRALDVKTTIAMPADLVDQGAKPHDVFVSGRHAFVSFVGLSDGDGVVVRYSTRTFAETGRIDTGADPHLFVDGSRLFIASQGGSEVSSFRVSTLAPLGSLDVPNAHGIYVTRRGEVFVTNIADGGVDGVQELNRRLSRVVDTVDTAVPTPHNLTVDNRRRAWVTHSGATADQVSIIDLERRGFGEVVEITVGVNPFGLAFVR